MPFSLFFPLFVVLPVVPVLTSSGHPTPESLSQTGAGPAAALVCWTGNSVPHITGSRRLVLHHRNRRFQFYQPFFVVCLFSCYIMKVSVGEILSSASTEEVFTKWQPRLFLRWFEETELARMWRSLGVPRIQNRPRRKLWGWIWFQPATFHCSLVLNLQLCHFVQILLCLLKNGGTLNFKQ